MGEEPTKQNSEHQETVPDLENANPNHDPEKHGSPEAVADRSNASMNNEYSIVTAKTWAVVVA